MYSMQNQVSLLGMNLVITLADERKNVNISMKFETLLLQCIPSLHYGKPVPLYQHQRLQTYLRSVVALTGIILSVYVHAQRRTTLFSFRS